MGTQTEERREREAWETEKDKAADKNLNIERETDRLKEICR
jgi:hypothetical protein